MFRINILLFAILAIILFSCKQTKDNFNSDDSKAPGDLKFKAYSNFGCYYDMSIDEHGEAVIATLRPKEFLINESNTDSLIDSYRFTITSEEDKQRLTQITKAIKNRKEISNSNPKDALRYIVQIGDITYIDINQNNAAIDTLIGVVLRYVKGEIQDRCEIFTRYEEKGKMVKY
jgi:hypothetical protein